MEARDLIRLKHLLLSINHLSINQSTYNRRIYSGGLSKVSMACVCGTQWDVVARRPILISTHFMTVCAPNTRALQIFNLSRSIVADKYRKIKYCWCSIILVFAFFSLLSVCAISWLHCKIWIPAPLFRDYFKRFFNTFCTPLTGFSCLK